jgi:hypothetical protein
VDCTSHPVKSLRHLGPITGAFVALRGAWNHAHKCICVLRSTAPHPGHRISKRLKIHLSIHSFTDESTPTLSPQRLLEC